MAFVSDDRPPACAEADEVSVAGAGDAEQAARVQHHQATCPRCGAREARLALVSAAVLQVDDRLNDVARARIGAAVASGLRGARPRRRRLGWWMLAPAVAAAGLLLALSPRRPPAVAPAAPPLIRPYQVAGAPGPRFDRSVDRLEVPAGTRIRASLGERARVTLIGPADVQVKAVSEGQMTLDLVAGTMLADYDRRAGGALVIHSPGVVTEVVGTRFAVEVIGGGSRVSVAHGRVTVRPADGSAPASVGAGQSWATADRTVRPMESATSTLLREPEVEVVGPPTRAAAAAASSVGEIAVVSPHAARATRPPVARRLAAAEPAGVSPAVAAPPPTPAAPPPPAEIAPPPVPAAAAAVAPAAPAPLPATASSLYAQAEAAMARRDQRESGRLLEQVVTAFPADPLADTARYELALRADAAGDHRTAARHAAWIAERGHEPALVEAAEQLGCRLAAQGGDLEGGRRCFTRFRARHGQSARDAEVLAALIQLARRAGDCDDVVRLVVEYLRRHPQGPFATAGGKIAESCAAR